MLIGGARCALGVFPSEGEQGSQPMPSPTPVINTDLMLTRTGARLALPKSVVFLLLRLVGMSCVVGFRSSIVNLDGARSRARFWSLRVFMVLHGLACSGTATSPGFASPRLGVVRNALSPSCSSSVRVGISAVQLPRTRSSGALLRCARFGSSARANPVSTALMMRLCVLLLTVRLTCSEAFLCILEPPLCHAQCGSGGPP